MSSRSGVQLGLCSRTDKRLKARDSEEQVRGEASKGKQAWPSGWEGQGATGTLAGPLLLTKRKQGSKRIQRMRDVESGEGGRGVRGRQVTAANLR